jgi:hypothetical protein
MNMKQEVTFIPPDRGRPCAGCTKCCQWLVAEVAGHKFGDGTPCYFLRDQGCGIYESRPIGCRSFQCLWKIDLNIPEWLKPNLVDVIMKTERLGTFEYVSISFAGNPDPRVFDWAREQKDMNFIIWNTKKVISNNEEFKNFYRVLNTNFGV